MFTYWEIFVAVALVAFINFIINEKGEKKRKTNASYKANYDWFESKYGQFFKYIDPLNCGIQVIGILWLIELAKNYMQ